MKKGTRKTPAQFRAAAWVSRAVLIPCVALCLCAATASAQTGAAKEAPATIEGRVTDGERGVPGVAVVLVTPREAIRTAARAKTDAEGRYRLTDVPPGRYQIMPVARTFVMTEMGGWPPGRPITLSAGETVEDIDFRVTPGGVITGRVTDADDRPVVAEAVRLTPADTPTGTRADALNDLASDQRGRMTDDRGVYRIYGLPPGRYRVSVGQDVGGGTVRLAGSRKFYPLTFHPAATDASQAKVVEVTGGGEVTDVDIKVAKPAKTYRVSGRFVYAETGQPAAGVTFGFGTLDAGGQRTGGFGGGVATNARGEFQVDGLAPGRYVVFAHTREATEFYSDTARFEIEDADVSGIVVVLHRGASVSGVVQIEGLSDRATAARLLQQIRLYAQVEASRELAVPGFLPVTVAADGTFRLEGLAPGRVRIGMPDSQAKGLRLARVELGGVEQRNGIRVEKDAQVTGARVVLAYGTAVIRGQVNVTGGTLPPGSRMWVGTQHTGDRLHPYNVTAEVDARGRFVLEGLPGGIYDLQVSAFSTAGRAYYSARQQVTVADGGEWSVTFVLDLGAAGKGGNQ